MARRRPSARGIRTHRNYTVEEAARVTGYAKGTIRRKIKTGVLPALTDRKPHLILGGDLHELLKGRTRSGPKLRLDECYCLKCRSARTPALGVVEYVPMTVSTGNVRALCSVCATLMHKAISKSSLSALQSILEVTIREADKHLTDSAEPSPNDHMNEEPGPHA